MFQLEDEEVASLRSHIATLKTGRGAHRKYAPTAFSREDRIPRHARLLRRFAHRWAPRNDGPELEVRAARYSGGARPLAHGNVSVTIARSGTGEA